MVSIFQNTRPVRFIYHRIHAPKPALPQRQLPTIVLSVCNKGLSVFVLLLLCIKPADSSCSQTNYAAIRQSDILLASVKLTLFRFFQNKLGNLKKSIEQGYL